MGKGGYLGGSTTFRTNPKLSGRKNPRKGAWDSWVEEARASGVLVPEGVRLKPLGTDIPEKKAPKKGKRKKAKKSQRRQDGNASGKVEKPFPEYEELVKALRDKYSK